MRRALTHYRIDETHSNAYAEWKRMGSPIAPTRPQYTRLEAAGQLEQLDAPSSLRIVDRGLRRSTSRCRGKAVSLIVIEWD